MGAPKLFQSEMGPADRCVLVETAYKQIRFRWKSFLGGRAKVGRDQRFERRDIRSVVTRWRTLRRQSRRSLCSREIRKEKQRHEAEVRFPFFSGFTFHARFGSAGSFTFSFSPRFRGLDHVLH